MQARPVDLSSPRLASRYDVPGLQRRAVVACTCSCFAAQPVSFACTCCPPYEPIYRHFQGPYLRPAHAAASKVEDERQQRTRPCSYQSIVDFLHLIRLKINPTSGVSTSVCLFDAAQLFRSFYLWLLPKSSASDCEAPSCEFSALLVHPWTYPGKIIIPVAPPAATLVAVVVASDSILIPVFIAQFSAAQKPPLRDLEFGALVLRYDVYYPSSS